MYNFTLKDPSFLPHIGCDFEFEFKRGQALFLTGENGIGKSTLLKRMGHSLENSFLLSQTPLDSFYDRSLQQFKKVSEKAFSQNLVREHFHKNWESFRLQSKGDRLLSQLSGGERQSVKLATALAMSSELLLLDEPTQYLDQEKKVILSEILAEILKQGRSLVIVEHDLNWWKRPGIVIPLQVRGQILSRGESWTIS